jgi:hypothetical protein
MHVSCQPDLAHNMLILKELSLGLFFLLQSHVLPCKYYLQLVISPLLETLFSFPATSSGDRPSYYISGI